MKDDEHVKKGKWATGLVALALAIGLVAVVGLMRQSGRDEPQVALQASGEAAEMATAVPGEMRLDPQPAAPPDQEEATGRSSAPASLFAAASVAELAGHLGDYRSAEARTAQLALIKMGPAIADDVVAATSEVLVQEQAARLSNDVDAYQRLATRKMQLIVVLGEIGGPAHAAALVEIARGSDPTSLAHQNVAIALGRMGAASVARSYAHEALANANLSAVQARGLLGQLVHFPSTQDQAIARRFMVSAQPDLVRDLGLLLGARSGLRSEVAALAPGLVLQTTGSDRDFYTLLALAEALPPDQFTALVEGSPLAGARPLKKFYPQALTHNAFKWAQPGDRQALLADQLGCERSEPVIAGLSYVLDSGRTDWLFDYGIVRDVRAARRAAGLADDPNMGLEVDPRYASLLGFTGYAIDVASGAPIIRKLAQD